VKGAKIALQHNLGLGGACVLGIYKKYNTNKGFSRADQTADPDKLEAIEKASEPQSSSPTPAPKSSTAA